MKKSLFWLVSTILFLTLPALAQRGQRGNNGNHGNNGGGHEQHNDRRGGEARGGDRHENRGGEARNDRRNEPRDTHRERDDRSFRGDRDRHERPEYRGRGYNWGWGRGRDHRDHWDGRRFDRDFERDHWGRDHRFYWGQCNWYGPRFYVGSYFWYNDGYFVLVESVPDYWDEEVVYVEYVDGYGYALVNPLYPGVYYHLSVRF